MSLCLCSVVTQTPAVVYNRAAASPTVTGDVPAYATNCANNVDYWSACQCFGITPTTVTVTAPTPTTTLAVPTCTQGVEYALWVFQQYSAEGASLQNAYYNFALLDRNAILAGKTPLASGVVAQVGAYEQGDYSKPFKFDGISAPDGTAMPYNVIEHRGYVVPAAAGRYEVHFNLVDDLAAVWIGEHAKSGITVDQSVLKAPLGTYNNPLVYGFNVAAADVGKPIPIRVFWGNAGGPGGHLWSIVDPTGAEILGLNSQKNSQIVASCSGPGTDVPEWPAWGTES